MNNSIIFIRSVLRKLRILKLIQYLQSVPLRRRKKELAEEYKQTLPKTVCISRPPAEVILNVVDQEQYIEMRLDREPRVLDFVLDNVKSGQVAWDIGANLGYFTLILGKLVQDSGKVASFEPEPGTLRQLEENIKLNGLTNITTVPIALSNSEAKMKMSVSDRAASGVSHLAYDQDQQDDETTTEVRVVRGDTLVDDNSVPVPNFIKIDVEGFELEVLQGLDGTLGRPECRTVLCEVHFALMEARGLRYNASEILNLLRRRGFTNFNWLDASHLAASK